jgi:hypothetical protein
VLPDYAMYLLGNCFHPFTRHGFHFSASKLGNTGQIAAKGSEGFPLINCVNTTTPTLNGYRPFLI